MHELQMYLRQQQQIERNEQCLPPVFIHSRPIMAGNVQGELTSQDLAEAFSEQLNVMSNDCQGASNISICCFTTEMPYKPSTTCSVQELITLLQDFREHMINGGKEIPIEVC